MPKTLNGRKTFGVENRQIAGLSRAKQTSPITPSRTYRGTLRFNKESQWRFGMTTTAQKHCQCLLLHFHLTSEIRIRVSTWFGAELAAFWHEAADRGGPHFGCCRG